MQTGIGAKHTGKFQAHGQIPEIGNSRLETGPPIGPAQTHFRRSPISTAAKAGGMRAFAPVMTKSPISGNAWLGREDSNLRMAESKSAALPLGYAPMRRKARTALAESGRTIVRGPPRRNGRGGRNLLPPKGARARLTRSTRSNAFGRVTRRAIPSLKGQTSSRHCGGSDHSQSAWLAQPQPLPGPAPARIASAWTLPEDDSSVPDWP